MDNVKENRASLEVKEGKLTKSLDSLKKSAFILGTGLIIFAAARNSVTYHLGQLWGGYGDFWQRQWIKIYQEFEHEWVLAAVGTAVVSIVPYWCFAFFFIFVDLTARPQFVLKYKIQQDKNVPPIEKMRVFKAVMVVLFNQTVVASPFVYFCSHLATWRGCDFGPELPTFYWVLFEFCIFILVEEFGFYYSHRLLHHPAIYKYIHKRHHEWTAPIGVVSLYCHPFEHILANMGPVVLGPLLMGSHIATAWLWFTITNMQPIISHCGYHLPFFPSPEAHDFHHEKFNNNFGVLGVLDRLHGTDTLFRQTKAYQRHLMLLSLTPMSQQIPDDPKKKAL